MKVEPRGNPESPAKAASDVTSATLSQHEAGLAGGVGGGGLTDVPLLFH